MRDARNALAAKGNPRETDASRYFFKRYLCTASEWRFRRVLEEAVGGVVAVIVLSVANFRRSRVDSGVGVVAVIVAEAEAVLVGISFGGRDFTVAIIVEAIA